MAGGPQRKVVTSAVRTRGPAAAAAARSAAATSSRPSRGPRRAPAASAPPGPVTRSSMRSTPPAAASAARSSGSNAKSAAERQVYTRRTCGGGCVEPPALAATARSAAWRAIDARGVMPMPPASRSSGLASSSAVGTKPPPTRTRAASPGAAACAHAAAGCLLRFTCGKCASAGIRETHEDMHASSWKHERRTRGAKAHRQVDGSVACELRRRGCYGVASRRVVPRRPQVQPLPRREAEARVVLRGRRRQKAQRGAQRARAAAGLRRAGAHHTEAQEAHVRRVVARLHHVHRSRHLARWSARA